MANKRNLGDGDDYNFDEFNDDDFNFDDDMDYDDPDDRKPRSTLSRFGSALREDALSPAARRKLLRDSIPSEYHNTLDAIDSITEAGSNLYNDSVIKEWEKTRSSLKKATRINAQTLRKMRLGFIADWAEKEDYHGGFDQNLEELEITSQMGVFGKSLKGALAESREMDRRSREDELEAQQQLDDDDREETRSYRETAIKQGNASFGMMREVRDLIGRQVDYQDQIAFNFQRQSIRTGIQQLLTQRKILELTALHRAESKDGMAAITKNTGLPDYAKITTEENAKRVLRDRFVNKASDWLGSKMGPIARALMRQTQTNITNMGQIMRDGLESYIDMAEMGQDMGKSQGSMFGDILMDAAAGKIRGAASQRLGGMIRRRISGNERASRIFDLLESGIADSGTFANMAMQGRSGIGLLDRLMDAGGYSGVMANMQNNRIFNSTESRMDEAAYMTNKFKLSVEEIIPGYLSQLVRLTEAMHKGVSVDQIPEQRYDPRFNRFRAVKDMQYEFDNETFSEDKIKSYQDGMDRWIDQLDPDHTLSADARRAIRGWLIQNHASGKESFATSLYRGENLPKGTSKEVKRELENKIPTLAGFDASKVDKLDGREGVDLELAIRRQNPGYSRRSKHLANVDGDSRSRMPIDNEKISKMTERFGPQALVRSKLGRYDAEGNISLNNDAIFELLGGGNKIYTQRNEIDADGNLTDLGATSNYDSEDAPRTQLRRLNSAALNGDTYKNWMKDQLHRMNHLPGFAKGGITGGKPDEVSGVTHGQEAVVNSSATKENKKLLSAINKLSAPFVLANGKINRVYYDALGMKGPEEVDELNNAKSKGALRDILDNKFQGGKVLDYLRGGLQQKGKQLWYQDGYNPNYMGPTPEFMGPTRSGGLRNNVFSMARGAHNYVMTPDAQGNLFNREHRAQQAKDLSMRVRHGIADFDYAGAMSNGKAKAADYATRAKAALERANVSKSVDWDATRLAIDKTIQEEGIDESELKSLYLQGMNSPFITKGDFAVGRYRNKSTGKVITKPSDIMDDIVLVDSNGQSRVIATMADMLEGVFDGRGKPVRMLGLEAGHRRYLKRTTAAGRAIKESLPGRIVLGIKDKVWDDIPVDIYTLFDGKMRLTLQASMFKAGLYRDKETGDVLKTHNDIRGEVINASGEVLLSLEELSGGLFDDKGNRLKISHLKHLRNKVVTKIENKFKQVKAKLTDKVLGKGLSFLEGAQQNEVYVMRWKGKGRELTLAFTMDDIKDGNLIDQATGSTITKLSEITGRVYSKRTKSTVVMDDELKYGLLDAKGEPLKDFKNMSIDDRMKHQMDKAYDKLAGVGNKIKASLKRNWSIARTELKGGITDIYVNGDKEPRISSAALTEGKYVSVSATGTVNTVKSYKDIIGPVWENFGEANQSIILSTEDLAKGLVDSMGNTLHINLPSDKPKAGLLGRMTSSLGRKVMAKVKSNMPDMKDLYLPDDLSAPALLATKLNAGKIINILSRKVVTSYADLKGGVTDSEDPSKLISAAQVETLVFADSSPVAASKKFGRTRSLVSGLVSGFKSKMSGLRLGSWQWKRAKKEEEERNRRGDVTVNVDNDGKEKKGFLGKLLAGLATTFGTMFGGMMVKFGKMFKKLRNAIMISKLASGAGSALSGAGAGAAGGRRGKLGLIAGLAGAGLTAYGGYHAYNAMSGLGEEGGEDEDGFTPEEKKQIAEQQADQGGFFNKAMELDASTGGLASTAAMTLGAGYLGNKLFNRGAAGAAGAAARPGLLSRIGGTARNGAGALGRGAADAGRAAAGAGRVGASIGGFLGRRVPGLARVGANVGGAIGRGLWKMGKPLGVRNLAKGAAMLGRGALAVGRVGLMAARVLSGPIGWGLMAATWIGGKLYDNYKNKQNPLMRFRMAQYGFDFDESDNVAKLLDLENLLKDFVTVGGNGGPAIKDNVPEGKVLELFGINPEDPDQQPHMERFIAWFQRRFKPVYLSYVKQMFLILKKTDLSSLDEELSKKDKLDLLSKVHFASPGNNPYMVSASPFADPEEVSLTVEDVQDAYKKAIKFVNKMPDDKKTEDIKKQVDENGKPVEKKDHNKSWLDSTKKGIEFMVDKSLDLTKKLAGKTSEIFNDWFGTATDKIKGLWDGASSWFDSATSTLTDKISNAMSKMSNLANQVVSGVDDATGGALSTGASMIGAGLNAAGNLLTGASSNAEQNLMTMAMKAGITSPTELAMFMAQVAHESGNFKYSKEIASGKAYEGRKDLGNTNPGDGVKYKGRGWIQITGKANYAAFSKWAGKDFVANPELLEKEPYASMAAVWYWTQHGNMTRRGRAAAQRGDIVGATKAVNGGTNGLQDRQKKYVEYVQKIGKDPNAYLAKLGGASSTAAAAVQSGAAQGVPMAPGTGPLKSSQGPQKQYVSQKEFDSLQKAAPKPPMMASKEVMDKWEKDEKTRKEKLAAVQKGMVAGTHVIGSAPKPDYNANGAPEASAGGVKKQETQAQNASQPQSGDAPPWMKIAMGELGNGETRNVDRANQYFSIHGLNYDVRKTAWCAAFASWCLKSAGYGTSKDIVRALGYSDYGKGLSKDNIPYGAICVVRSHVFFCAGVENGRVKALGGNQGNPGSVTISSFPLKDLVAVRWPEGAAQGTAASPTSVGYAASTQLGSPEQKRPDYNAGRQQEAGGTNNATTSGGGFASTTQAQQQRSQAQQQAQSSSTDQAVWSAQLDEAKKQTSLLTEIRDHLVGVKDNTRAAADRPVTNMDDIGKNMNANTQLMVTAVQGFAAALKQQKQGNLSQKYPVNASK